MKKFFLAAVAALSAGLVFVACKKESINTEEVAINQSDKQQKSDGTEVIENYPIALSPDDYPFAYSEHFLQVFLPIIAGIAYNYN